MRKIHAPYLFLLLALLCWTSPSLSNSLGDAYAGKARHVILMDYDTGEILYERDPDTPTHPSSMTKIMTVYLAFERLKDGRITLQDKLPVSTKAWKTGGSRMFIEPNTYVTIEDLLKGVVIVSGNDASVALAEGLGGNEENFAAEMTERAHALGAKTTSFKNAHGLAEDGHFTTARDLATISRSIIKEFPEYYPYFAETTYEYNNIKQPNRNPLLSKRHLSADGLKTGVTDYIHGGYGLVGSAKKGNRRLILVVNGLETEKERATVSEQLMSWGFREFDNVTLFKAGDTVDTANTWLGASPTVTLTTLEDITLTLEKSKQKQVKVEAVYEAPIEAPIRQGQEIGKLVITIPGKAPIENPLVAGNSVEPVGAFQRVFSALNYIIWGQS